MSPACPEHIVRAPAGRQRVVGVTAAARPRALHVAVAGATLRVSKALVRVFDHQRLAGRVNVLAPAGEINRL